MGLFKKSKGKVSGSDATSKQKKTSYKPGSRGPVVGIDLGTTYSCVGIYQYGNVEIIANDHGYRITPSYVAFTETERLLGNAAKDQAVQNPRNTIFDAKRLIGKDCSDGALVNDIKHWPFGVDFEGDKPKLQVVYKGEPRSFHAEEISAMVLEKMKRTAEAYLGRKVYEAVITVPAYFNDSQRQATKDAGSIAGLDVLRIINEPTAAAMAYGLDNKTSNTDILVYDLGGGTFDVSVLNVDDGFFEVKSTSGDTHLGGSDFDNLITDHLIRQFQKQHGIYLANNKRAISRLKVAAERAKRELSANVQATIEIENLCDNIDFRHMLSRAKFEDLCGPLFKKTLEYIDRALEDARISKSKIDEVVLVGGSTRIPKIRKLIKDHFYDFLGGETKINTEINPDEAIAYGAAIQAAILCSNDDRVVDETVFEGESKKTSDNRLLGTFELIGLPKAPRATVPIEVTFDVDANGILNVSAEDLSSGHKRSITITNDKGRLSSNELAVMKISAEKINKDNLAIMDKQHGPAGKKNDKKLGIGSSDRLMIAGSEPVLEELRHE